ncbi:hypothetical protein [Vibrio crassostreae]|uniref:hypothetical protein n=1 Tax=Vibrio crassostreae TaxID=246167 RepID=UPI000F50B177|nr:hypothetical protein [Vibrio crassostreae]
MFPIKEYLQYVNLAELHKKITEFRDLDIKNLKYTEIQESILKVISFTTPIGDCCLLKPHMASYPKGTRFYRIRAIPEGIDDFPLKSMSTISDCWEPPAHVVGIGRLNKVNESLLYVSPTPDTACEELRVLNNEYFSLIVYEALEEIKVSCIGFAPNVNGLSEEEALKLRMIQDFLKHEFIRDVGKGTEFLYKISESITKDYFDLPPELQDAWCYPSIANKGGYNVCFKPQDRNKLKLHGVQIAKAFKFDEGYAFKVKLVGKLSSNNNDLSFYTIGTNQQKELFPEISTQIPEGVVEEI